MLCLSEVMAKDNLSKLARGAGAGLLALLFLTSCQASQTSKLTPTLQEATLTVSGATPYSAPPEVLETGPLPSAYPGPDASNQTIPPGGDQSAYPVPYPGDTTPVDRPQIPDLTATQLINTARRTAMPTASAAIPTSTPVGEYPLPEDGTFSDNSQTFDPYPGPDIQEPGDSLLPGEPTEADPPGDGSVETGTPQVSATLTPTPGRVRTQLEASDPKDFRLAAGKIQLVEFFAFWSPISKSMAPGIYTLEDRYQVSITFAYLDIDDPANSLYKTLLGNRLPPVFFLLDGQGNVLHEWKGFVKADEFVGVFDTLVTP